MRTADVAILGGGGAGLAAAAELFARGLDVVVIEARDRVGGRIFTVRDGGDTPIELGPEFVHGEAHATERVAHDAGAALVDAEGKHWRHDGRALTDASGIGPSLDALMARIARTAKRTKDRSFAEALDATKASAAERALALRYIEGFQAADAARISERGLAMGDLGSERSRRVVHGYDRIANALAAKLPRSNVLLSSCARRVAHRPREVRVECTNGVEVQAKRLVVALPLSLLQAPSLASPTFDPPLASKRRALAGLAMGNVEKIVLRFDTMFWSDPNVVPVAKKSDRHKISFVHGGSDPFQVWWTSYPILSPFFTGWCGGPRSNAVASLDDGALVACASTSLAKALGIAPRDVERRITGWWRHAWSSDPFSLGAYSYPLVGGANAARALRRPIDATIFFAGEATCDPPANGTVDGAIASGVRAAHDVLASLG